MLGRNGRADLGQMPDRAALVINLPVVAWKRKLVEPVAAAARARLTGHRVVVVLHEWGDLDWKRRASYSPLLLLADTVLFSCPLVDRSFATAVVSPLTTRARGVLPIPPNVSLPATLRSGPHSERVRRERGRDRMILGHFGSIYPRKRSTFVLDVAAEIKARGEAPFVVFAGSFIQGQDAVEREFFDHVRRLGLEDDVLVTGFIAAEDQLFDLLTLVDAFVYSFAEGLSTRRASVFACLTAGRPVVVNAPPDMEDLNHHPVYRTLLGSGLLRLVPTGAGTAEIADAVLAVRAAPTTPPLSVAETAWAAAAQAFTAAVVGGPAS